MNPFLFWLTLWAEKLRTKTGWRRYGAAYFYGALAALCFPPFNTIPVLWFCFPALIFLLQGATTFKQAFGMGWCFAFGLLTLSLYWIAGALFVDIKAFWWVLPLAIAGLPALFALYYGIAAVAAWRWGLHRFSGLLFFALTWFVADYARGHMFTGFPWDVLGYAWGDVLPVLQITSVIGIYGLTLLTLLLVVLPVGLITPMGKPSLRRLFPISLVLLLAVATWGLWRLHHTPDAMVAGVRLRLVQANTDQSMKWKQGEREKNFQRLLDTSFDKPDKVTHVIWPETASAYYLNEDIEHRLAIAKRMQAGQSLITGVVTRVLTPDGDTQYYNSLIAIDDKANVVAGYDKFHLVPFGEYIPFRNIIPVRTVSSLGLDFSAGDAPHTVRVAGLPPFSPLICYEAIFSDNVLDATDQPRFLLNVTNDAWYEHTTGPYQHFAIARVRAIEEGIPLVRVANKGVVGVVDGVGRVKAMIGWEKAGFIDSDLPEALAKPTLYSCYHEGMFWIPFAVVLLGVFGMRLSSRHDTFKP